MPFYLFFQFFLEVFPDPQVGEFCLVQVCLNCVSVKLLQNPVFGRWGCSAVYGAGVTLLTLLHELKQVPPPPFAPLSHGDCDNNPPVPGDCDVPGTPRLAH